MADRTLDEDLRLLGCPWHTQEDIDTALTSRSKREAFGRVVGKTARSGDPFRKIFDTILSLDKRRRVFWQTPKG